MNEAPAAPGASVGRSEALRTWARIGLLSFGGPTAQIAVMHRILVDEKRWFDERRFLEALSFCMLLPGPEAMQLATHAGWRLHGVRGGFAAGVLFVLPGALVILALSASYAAFGRNPWFEAAFLGIKAAVLAIVLEAILRIAKRAIRSPGDRTIAILSFVAIFFFNVPFPVIVFAAATYGALRARADDGPPAAAAQPPAVSLAATARTFTVGVAIWLLPLFMLGGLSGPAHVLAEVGAFFARLAVVTFGGAYAVLAYMGQDVVTRHGWLNARQMVDGLGLAETTPGPLILVAEFVGFMAGFRAGGPLLAVAAAGVTLWATFAPCFVWIFTGGPWMEWLTSRARIRGALSAITSAVVGVIANLATWFSLHVWFGNVTSLAYGPLRVWRPVLATADWLPIALSLLSAWLLLRRHWAIPYVLALTAAIALGIRLVGVH